MIVYKELENYNIIEQDEDNILSVPADCFPVSSAFLVQNDGIFVDKAGNEIEVKAGDIVTRIYGFLSDEVDAKSWHILKDEYLASVMKEYYEKEETYKDKSKVDISAIADQLNALQEQVNELLKTDNEAV